MLHALACFRHMNLSMQVLAALHALTLVLQNCGLLQGYQQGTTSMVALVLVLLYCRAHAFILYYSDALYFAASY